MLRGLRHTNIVRYLGVERVADSVYVLEEWVPGGSVASLVAQFGPLPDSVTREYTVQALRGLVYLHSHDLIHRDVKGANMLVTDDGILKLADFGSGRGIYSKQPYTEYISTRWYRAPECLLTDGYYGPEMDLWGAGCALATARARARTPRGT